MIHRFLVQVNRKLIKKGTTNNPHHIAANLIAIKMTPEIKPVIITDISDARKRIFLILLCSKILHN